MRETFLGVERGKIARLEVQTFKFINTRLYRCFAMTVPLHLRRNYFGETINTGWVTLFFLCFLLA